MTADNFTATTSAAAAVESTHALPADDKPTLAEVVDHDGWFPGRFRDSSDWNVGRGWST